MKSMKFSKLPREFVQFRVRADRPNFIGRRFQTYLTGTVLDVGCDEAVLRNLVRPKTYAGVGMTEQSDVKVDLEKQGRLPFKDGTWETVLCLDVLEHLNNFHDFSNEIFRVASRYVILSLPNCWSQARRSLAEGFDLAIRTSTHKTGGSPQVVLQHRRSLDLSTQTGGSARCRNPRNDRAGKSPPCYQSFLAAPQVSLVTPVPESLSQHSRLRLRFITQRLECHFGIITVHFGPKRFKMVHFDIIS